MTNKFSILNEAKHFSTGILQNYLVFLPAKKRMKYFSVTTRIRSRKSNGMSEGHIENITRSDSNFAPILVDYHLLPDIYFNGHCLINDISIPEKVTKISISYALIPWLRNLNTDFTFKSCLFGSVKLTKNADLDNYKYNGCNIGFDCCSELSFTDGSMGKKSLILQLI